MAASPGPRSSLDWRVPTPDNVLLRRFGIVRAVGGAAYVVAVVVLFGLFGRQIWPLALGVPILAVVTTGYFVKSARYPRAAVAVSLVADAFVLGGAIAFLGGSGSGLVMLYAIVVVSAGILLGPVSAASFALFTMFLGVLQLVMEELGVQPVLLHRGELGDRVPILLVSLAGLASVGYLAATYASRLHQLIAIAGEEAEAVRRRGRRRRSFVERAAVDVQQPLRDVEQVAETLEERWQSLDSEGRRTLAGQLRMGVMLLDAEIGKLADASVMDETRDRRPDPVRLQRVVSDCLGALAERLEPYEARVDVPPLSVVGDRRAARRAVLNVLENVVEHTPPGTQVRITALTSAGQGVLVISDNGPGIPPEAAPGLFDPPDQQAAHVGLPLVRELCEQMGAEVRYEPVPSGGARFLLAFRLAPPGAPAPDDDRDARAS